MTATATGRSARNEDKKLSGVNPCSIEKPTGAKILNFPKTEKINRTIIAIVKEYMGLPPQWQRITLILLTDKKTRKIFED
jgi:hypothetical protein